jgi:hypothetical protein
MEKVEMFLKLIALILLLLWFLGYDRKEIRTLGSAEKGQELLKTLFFSKSGMKKEGNAGFWGNGMPLSDCFFTQCLQGGLIGF